MIFELLLIGLATSALYYLIFAYKRANYWRSQGVPGPKNPLFFGLYDQVYNANKPWMMEMEKMTKEYGKIWGHNEGVHRVLVVADPKVAHEIYHTRHEEFQTRRGNHLLHMNRYEPVMHLLDARGTRWKRMRSISNPLFTNNSLRKMMDLVGDSSEHLIKHLSKHVGKEAFNIHRYYQEFSMDVINRLALGEKRSTQFETELVDIMKRIFERDMREPFICLAVMFPRFRMLFRRGFELYYLMKGGSGMKLMKKVVTAVEGRRKARAAGEVTPGDFIDMFLDAEQEDFNLDYDKAFDRRDIGHLQRALTKEEAIGSCFMFLLAGFDTTANSLGYATHYLARNPEIRERLRDEIKGVIGDATLKFDDLPQMKYLDCFVKESLRFHPVANQVSARVVEKDCDLAGVHLEKGTIIQIDGYSMQKDPEVWGDDAEEFNPDRWMNTTAEQSQAFVAFGQGPRMCVGQRLGLTEMKMGIAKVLLNFDVIAPENADNEIHRIGAVTVAPITVDVCLKAIHA
ncbi:unnamed protein product, partial [Mesorhabditis belari]|uniref:Cytochrome P450 n=1 Tax=Mesorhabditis belari TaxID=2138241 RepID=A0AAF3EPY3_9BILA